MVKQTKEERLGFLQNEQSYLKLRIHRLKTNKNDPRDPEEIAWFKEYKPNLSFEECSNEFGY